MSLSGLNHFSKAPNYNVINRSSMKRPSTYKTTFNSGELIPIFCDEVLPGDTFTLDTSFVVRGITPIVPVMDNAYLDLYFFFVPRRLCSTSNFATVDHLFERVMGENFDGYWAEQQEYELTTTWFTGCVPGSVANYFGLPLFNKFGTGTYQDGILINPDRFRAYNLIWNDWFRDQNSQAPIRLDFGFTDNTGDYVDSINSPNDSLDDDADFSYFSAGCLPVNKFHDYFTSALPAPQKGDPVKIGLSGTAPIQAKISGGVPDTLDLVANNYSFVNEDHSVFQFMKGSAMTQGQFYNVGLISPTGSSAGNVQVRLDNAGTANADNNIIGTNLSVNAERLSDVLEANLANTSMISINQLRQAFAIQRLLERDARSGTRYIEILQSHFGTTIRNDVIQRPEYLGGKRVPLNITQVLQTSSTNETAPLGYTGAFSNTSDYSNSFTKSFVEHGFVIGVACVRTMQSYSQGIEKSWFRTKRYDFYWPEFAYLGEQVISNKELFVSFQSNVDDQVFGYQEAWADYRYKNSIVTGLLSPQSDDLTFRPWTYGNDFETLPVLNSDFMKQSATNIGNTLAVTDSKVQFIGDFYFKLKCTRPMPIYSIPGLIDHM